MGSVGVVAEKNGDGQAPGGAARGTPATNWWGGENHGNEGNTQEVARGGEVDCACWNQEETVAAMADRGDPRRGGGTPVD